MARKPTPKQLRSQVIRSLSLVTIADEVNRMRLAALREKIETATPAQRKRMPRLIRLYEAGQLETVDDLPADLKADARRMKNTLFALHLAMGENFYVTRSVKDIAELARMTEQTTRRGVLDLENACLIIVTRRERPRRTGGQGVSQYQLVSATLRDIALSQGLQGELFDCGRRVEGDSDAVAESFGGPDESSGQSHPTGPFPSDAGESPGTPSHGGNAPSHHGNPPSHGGRPPSHHGRAYRPRAGESPAESPESLSERTEPPSSSSPEPPCVSSEEGTTTTGVSERQWLHVVSERLKDYGLGSHYQLALIDAPKKGWTARQLLEFCDDLERETIGDVRKFKPGAVWWQLTYGEPGSRITMPPREEWTREKRNEALRAARERDAVADADKAERRQAERAAEQEREERLGPVLDAMPDDELRAFVAQAVPFAVAAGRRKWLTTFRTQLLNSLDGELAGIDPRGD